MKHKILFINKITYITVLIWSLIMLLGGFFFICEHYEYARVLAKNEAVVSVKKDLAYRTWVASHGGIYVPITKKTPPSPYLAHIENRDVTTNAGQNLTLINPAYTLSQMMKDYSQLYGTKGHITSLKLLNPNNVPDAWEKEALKRVEITKTAEFEEQKIAREEYFRYLNPLITQTSCLKCHAFQGYKVGDVRGAVSVAIPMKSYNTQATLHAKSDIIFITLIYILGLIVIFYGRKKSKEIMDTKIRDYEQHIFSLVKIIEKRDRYTAGHSQRVATYSALIAKEMGYSKHEVDTLYRACMLHDIGKISTPDSILLKPEKLNNLEYEIIKEHVTVSYELLNKVDIYRDIANIVRYHHEYYDGSGYPDGLKGDEIPLLSQIMTVADAFDAMTTNRVCKARKSIQEALTELQNLSHKQFNPNIADVASRVLHDVTIEMNITQSPLNKIEEERFSYFYKDQITDLYNRSYLKFVLANNHTDEFHFTSVDGIYLNNFNQYNKKQGWTKGDILLKKLAEALITVYSSDFIFRVYGDDFIVLHNEQLDIQNHISKLEAILLDSDITITYKHINIEDREIQNIQDLEKLF
jgi:putative nucleotidyltransferase with HDIG domain/diguanylate cyclase (GGDEF)-like protein